MLATKEHFECLSKAFEKLLGAPTEGKMAFVRCLSSEVIAQLSTDWPFSIPGWRVYAVTGLNIGSAQHISADQAVDLRERKEGSILLLVDSKVAGAGMDGIYSAVREIREAELFKKATGLAVERLPRKQRKFAQIARKSAARIGRRNTIAPWQEFNFFAHCAATPESVGSHVALLGLWPIDTSEALHEECLEESVQVVERLLLATGSSNTTQARIASLLLQAEPEDQVRELENLLRESESERWTSAVLQVVQHPNLWLNRLKPGFLSQELKGIDLIPWRKSRDAKPLAWTGLKLQGDGTPVFYAGKERSSRLQVRWKTTPLALKAGSIVYQVSIITGSDTELLSKAITHSGKSFESCVFVLEDFEEMDSFDETGKWEVEVQVHVLGQDPPESEDDPFLKRTESFVLTFDDHVVADSISGVGKKARALVEEAIKLTESEFEEACSVLCKEDGKGYISYRVAGKSGRVYRPPLIKLVEEDWETRGFGLGRWVIRVREEGSPIELPGFIPLPAQCCDLGIRKRIEDATRQLCKHALKRCGFIGCIHHNSEETANYVRAWISALESGGPDLALANTVEVQSQAGLTLGVIVLPSHPMRLAWHQAYDELAYHTRYEEKLKPNQVVKALTPVDGSYFPAFLPGLTNGTSFVFGDTLGFYAVAMIRSDESEPQAAIALMARCLASVGNDAAPSVGNSTAEAIALEMVKYAELHDAYRILRMNALRSGDGRTVVRALGRALSGYGDDDFDDGILMTGSPSEGYILDIFPSDDLAQTRMIGRYLSETAEKRRSGVAAVPAEDRWMLETFERDGVSLPRLRWSKCRASIPSEPAHLTIAFDTFVSSVVAMPDSEINPPRPIEAFGLFPSLMRSFRFDPIPTWHTNIAPYTEGDKHPASRLLTERLQKIHAGILRSVVRNLGAEASCWPVLRTEVTAERADSLKRLHELSDWVVTVDRNAGLEFFDAPRENPEVYDTYVIDCVPERQDLESVQLVTSTSQIEEVMRLLDQALADMSLSCSPRNCKFLLSQLKALSGRLAMRLSFKGQTRGELIALALFYSCCERHHDDPAWLSAKTGFFVPLDDVRDLLFQGDRAKTKEESESDREAEESAVRADMVYVDLPKRGGLRFTFVEIKYRRLLRSARQASLLEQIRQQTAKTRRRWFDDYFSEDLTTTQLAVRRKRLARALRFYADKAHRHTLEDDAYGRLSVAIDKLYQPNAEINREDSDDRGYIFCPDYALEPGEIDFDGSTRIFLFGPVVLPDRPGSGDVGIITNHFLGDVSAEEEYDESRNKTELGAKTKEENEVADDRELVAITDDSGSEPLGRKHVENILIGHTEHSGALVEWRLSIRGNPHLMIVGLPGMGKTTCLINLCKQLFTLGIVPIVFSYHDDIDGKLLSELGELHFVDMEMGIGFNPLRVVGKGPYAWIDNVAMLRDIFAAIFPDLGDLQTHEIREAIKQSYTDVGYGVPGLLPQELPVPEFQCFFDILKQKGKPNPGVMARLSELNDYGFFRQAGDSPSLLESKVPVVIRIHLNQNEVLQNALASFVLFNIYQNMFVRGTQDHLTHAVIFDEAHRASRLKLLPTMAKECRKYGISLINASQAAKDFNPSLYSAIANYLVLRVTEADAYVLAKNVVQTTDATRIAGRLKQLEKFKAMFFSEGSAPIRLKLYCP